jgi:transcriptional regulator GlxA family with amidase domain
LFAPPYDKFEASAESALHSKDPARGRALIWWLEDGVEQELEFEQLAARAPGLPLIVLLPAASEIRRTLPLLNRVLTLLPRSVLPAPYLGTPEYLRQVLASPPRSVSEAATRYLKRRGVLTDEALEREVKRIFELAPEISSVTKLARRMYTSRRTLGRHFALSGVPVPSHWLQFARLLHITILLQNESSAVFRIATRAGYPDGFTMSNQMKRLIGYRPTEVRAWLGWEWVIEAWLQREAAAGHLRMG